MKKILLYTLLSFFTIGLIGYIYISITPPASPLETINYLENGNDITITYSRPYKKDRLIFGEESDDALVPFNKYWRTGANNHTTIEIKNPITIDNNTLNKGLYSIYTFPGKDSWDVVFNETNSFWGVMQPDPKNDLFTISVPSSSLDQSIEQFTIDFIPSSANGSPSTGIRLRWDLTEVIIPFN